MSTMQYASITYCTWKSYAKRFTQTDENCYA